MATSTSKQTEEQTAHSEEPEVVREFVKYSFFKLDRAWRQLDDEVKQAHKAEFASIVEDIADKSWIRSYSTVGFRADSDLMIRQISTDADDFRSTMTRLESSGLGHYLDQAYSYLGLTRQSPYRTSHRHTEIEDKDGRSWDLKYFVVYPMVKKREWYQKSKEDRQSMMVEHFKVGHAYPSIKINTAYSFGLDDQEFLVAFETDVLADFLDLVQELRTVEAGFYTEREIPIFTTALMPIKDALEALGS
jgi:chlorite dismutase